jgi:hypothetical protein
MALDGWMNLLTSGRSTLRRSESPDSSSFTKWWSRPQERLSAVPEASISLASRLRSRVFPLLIDPY